MPLYLAGLLLNLLAAACWLLVLIHAFRRSVGTGILVLGVPVYNIVYGFTQFEHRRKGLVLAGWLGGMVLGATLCMVGLRLPR